MPNHKCLFGVKHCSHAGLCDRCTAGIRASVFYGAHIDPAFTKQAATFHTCPMCNAGRLIIGGPCTMCDYDETRKPGDHATWVHMEAPKASVSNWDYTTRVEFGAGMGPDDDHWKGNPEGKKVVEDMHQKVYDQFWNWYEEAKRNPFDGVSKTVGGPAHKAGNEPGFRGTHPVIHGLNAPLNYQHHARHTIRPTEAYHLECAASRWLQAIEKVAGQTYRISTAVCDDVYDGNVAIQITASCTFAIPAVTMDYWRKGGEIPSINDPMHNATTVEVIASILVRQTPEKLRPTEAWTRLYQVVLEERDRLVRQSPDDPQRRG